MAKYTNIEKLPEGFRYDTKRDQVYAVPGANTESQLGDIRTQFSQPQAPEQPKLPKGVFTNKATGEYYNAQGQKVDALGSIISTETPVAEKDYLTGENLISSQMQETADIAKKYGLGETPTTIEEAVAKFKEGQVSETEYQTEQQKAQAKLDEANLNRMKRTGESSVAGTEAALAQSREGAMGTSAPLAVSAFKTEIGKRFEEAATRVEMAQRTRAKSKEDLKRAQESGNEALAEQIKGAIAGAEMQILEAKNDNLSLLATANEDARAAEASTRANMESFVGIVNTGTEMNMEGIATMADTLSIPLDMAYDYYNGAQIIRDDKTLDNETKQVELNQLTLDFENSIKGISTSQAQNAEYLKGLYQSGASDEEISAAKQLMGISDENDPMYQAELALSTANAAIKVYEADNQGKPPPEGTIERLEYDIKEIERDKAQMEMDDLKGVDEEVSQEDLKNIFSLPGDSRITDSFGEGQKECGEAYNDITENGVHAGNTYASKIDGEKSSIPQAGYGLALDWGDNSHIGTVLSSKDGVIKTVEWNRNLKGNRSFNTYNLSDDGTLIDETNGKEYEIGKNAEFMVSNFKPEFQDKLNALKTGQGVLPEYEDFVNGLPPDRQVNFASLNDTQQSNVKQLINGEVRLKDLMASRGIEGSKAKQQLLKDVQSVDPSFSQNANELRYNFMQKWNDPNAKQFVARTSLNTAMEHLAQMKVKADALMNSGLQKYNSIGNMISKETGNPQVVEFEYTMNVLAAEIASAYKGGSATDQEIEADRENLSSYFSNSQLTGVANTAADLLASKVSATGDGYHAVMGKYPDEPLIYDKALNDLQDSGIDTTNIEEIRNEQLGTQWSSEQTEIDTLWRGFDESKASGDFSEEEVESWHY